MIEINFSRLFFVLRLFFVDIHTLLFQKYNVYDVNAVLQGQSHKFTKEKLNFETYKSICDFVRNLQLKPDRQTNLLFSVS